MLHSLRLLSFFDLPHNELYLKCTQLKCFFYLIRLSIFHSNCINGFERKLFAQIFPAYSHTHTIEQTCYPLLPFHCITFFMFAILIMKKHRHYITDDCDREKWKKFNRANDFQGGWKPFLIFKNIF